MVKYKASFLGTMRILIICVFLEMKWYPCQHKSTIPNIFSTFLLDSFETLLSFYLYKRGQLSRVKEIGMRLLNNIFRKMRFTDAGHHTPCIRQQEWSTTKLRHQAFAATGQGNNILHFIDRLICIPLPLILWALNTFPLYLGNGARNIGNNLS